MIFEELLTQLKILEILSAFIAGSIIPIFFFKRAEFEKYKDERVKEIDAMSKQLSILIDKKDESKENFDNFFLHLESMCLALISKNIPVKIARYKLFHELIVLIKQDKSGNFLLKEDTKKYYGEKISNTSFLILQDCYNIYCRNFILRAWYKIIIRLRIFCRGY
jgi:hypothetical protein